MALYTFVAVDKYGKQSKQTLEAPNIERLKNIVQTDGTYILSVKESGVWAREIDFSRVKPKDLAVFCEQMLSITKAGIPTIDAIEMVSNTTQCSKLKKTLILVIERVRAGISLSAALREYPDVFPLIMIQMIHAGEESGSLDEIFERLAVQFEKSATLKNQIKKALAYPKMILAVVVLALVVVCAVVVPQFVDIFNQIGTDLPFTTKIFIWLSDVFTNYWWLAIIVVVSLSVLWVVFSRSKVGIRLIATAKLKIPLFKDLEQKSASADLARTLSTLLKSGMDYPKALDIASQTMSNIIFKEAVEQIKSDVENGFTLTSAMKKSAIFPELLINLLQIGENTGNVEDMLENSANYFEDEVQTATVQLTTAINPIIMIIMGIFVGMLVWSIYTPMFSMYEGIG